MSAESHAANFSLISAALSLRYIKTLNMLNCFTHHKRYVHISNSCPASVVYIRQWIGSALVQIMACRLFGDKPLSKPSVGYYQLGPRKTCQWNVGQKSNSSFKKLHLKMSSSKWRPFLCKEKWVKSYHGVGVNPVNEINSGTIIHVVCPAQPIACFLMLWRLEKPEHHQA